METTYPFDEMGRERSNESKLKLLGHFTLKWRQGDSTVKKVPKVCLQLKGCGEKFTNHGNWFSGLLKRWR
jgi:hypothetical protein